MIKKLKNINWNLHLLAVLAVAFVLFVSYGQTLGMYFWQDDSALIFKLQHQEEAAGSYGLGIIGEGPYKYLITPFVPFFPVFGMNPFGYFMVGFIAYGISTAAFYLFSSQLLQSRKAGFISTLIFAAGYIGSDTMFRISNSWQTNFGLTFALLSFWAYVKFFSGRFRILFYLVSLLFFYLSVEFVYIRSHSLIFPIFILDLLFTIYFFKLLKIPWLLLRQIPFWFIFYHRYMVESIGSSGVGSVFKSILEGKLEVLASFFAILGNIFVAYPLQAKFLNLVTSREQQILLISFMIFSIIILNLFSAARKFKILAVVLLTAAFFLNRLFISKDLFWYRTTSDFISGALGLYVSVFIITLSLVLRKEMKILSLTLLLGLVVASSQIFGYFIQYQEAIFSTTHRYLSYSFIGYSMVLGGVAYAVFLKGKKKLSIFLLGITLFTNIYLGFSYQNKFLGEVSRPTGWFYKELKNEVPEIKKGALFHFDIDGRNFYRQQFNNFFSVGSMPESTALAIYYGVDRYDVSLIGEFDELLYKLSLKQADLDNIYNLYYGPDGLKNVTEETRNLLKNGSKPEKVDIEKSGNLNTKPLTPMLLTVKARVVPDTASIFFPYSSSGQEISTQSFQEKKIMLNFLLSRGEYFRTVSPSSLSEWKFQETVYVSDNNLDTSWRGHRIYWHEKRHEQLNLDLGSIKKIGKLIWKNWTHTLTPTGYTIELSEDGNNFKTVKKVVNGPERSDGEIVEENFDDTNARFVRMDITSTLSNDAPAISEAEVIDSLYDGIDINKAFAFAFNPFEYVENKEEMEFILSRSAPLIEIVADLETDKGGVTSKSSVKNLSTVNDYEFILSPGGTKIKSLNLSIKNAPVKLNIESAEIRNLNLSDIEQRGLIKEFKEN